MKSQIDGVKALYDKGFLSLFIIIIILYYYLFIVL